MTTDKQSPSRNSGGFSFNDGEGSHIAAICLGNSVIVQTGFDEQDFSQSNAITLPVLKVYEFAQWLMKQCGTVEIPPVTAHGPYCGAPVSETAFNIPEIIRRSTWKTPELRESAAKLVQVIIEEHAK